MLTRIIYLENNLTTGVFTDDRLEILIYEAINNIITIHTTYQDGWITISIGDNGLGMTEAVRQKLFNAFFTTKPKGKGTGLGLSISYEIVT